MPALFEMPGSFSASLSSLLRVISLCHLPYRGTMTPLSQDWLSPSAPDPAQAGATDIQSRHVTSWKPLCLCGGGAGVCATHLCWPAWVCFLSLYQGPLTCLANSSQETLEFKGLFLTFFRWVDKVGAVAERRKQKPQALL